MGSIVLNPCILRVAFVLSFYIVASNALSNPTVLLKAPTNTSQALPVTQPPVKYSTPTVSPVVPTQPTKVSNETLVSNSSETNTLTGTALISQPAVHAMIIPELNQIPTKISLYTRRNPISGHTIIHNVPATVELATFYSNESPTRIIIHGSFDGLDFGHWMRDMKGRLLDVEDSNIIVVDWSSAASNNIAQTRLANSRVVGHQVAMILQNLIQLRGLKPEDVHVIAHGDGTFAADVIGRSIPGLGRITGLNPHGPNIESLPIDQRLDRSDALFVDVIHTDEQNSTLSFYKRGTTITLGDVDYYPNGGSNQPGCNLDDLEEMVKKAISEGIRTFLSCSHYRAIDYFLESITGPGEKCLHLAYECKNYDDFVSGVCGHCNDDSNLCAEMGFRANLYYYSNSASDRLKTSSSSSASVQSSTVVTDSPTVNPIRGIIASLTRGKRKVSVSGLDMDTLQSLQKPEHRESTILEAAKKKDSLRLYYNTSKKKPFCLYHYNIQVNMASEPAQVRGGLLRLRIDGSRESIEVKLYGGTSSFKAGYTTGLIATHYGDIGTIKGVSVNWLPNSIVTLLYGENLFLEDIRIAQIGWDLNKLKTDDMTTLCPTKKTGIVTPFYGETYFLKSSNCTYSFKY